MPEEGLEPPHADHDSASSRVKLAVRPHNDRRKRFRHHVPGRRDRPLLDSYAHKLAGMLRLPHHAADCIQLVDQLTD
jgi:hypothetical protein